MQLFECFEQLPRCCQGVLSGCQGNIRLLKCSGWSIGCYWRLSGCYQGVLGNVSQKHCKLKLINVLGDFQGADMHYQGNIQLPWHSRWFLGFIMQILRVQEWFPGSCQYVIDHVIEYVVDQVFRFVSMVFLCASQNIMRGFQGVARVFWVNARVIYVYLRVLGGFQGLTCGWHGVARVLWVVARIIHSCPSVPGHFQAALSGLPECFTMQLLGC